MIELLELNISLLSKTPYCEQRWNGFGNEIIGAKNLDKLYARIDPFTLRATKSELDLPEKIYDTYPFEMTDEQKKAYKELKKRVHDRD